jgi:heme/copper-type cytochrome/quinol oxidase subunit 4
MAAAGSSKNVIAKYLPVYFILLFIAALEFFAAFRIANIPALLPMLLGLAICSGALALLYFMHLVDERRSLFLSLIPATIFVLIMMNMFWSDSYRLLHMKPFAH